LRTWKWLLLCLALVSLLSCGQKIDSVPPPTLVPTKAMLELPTYTPTATVPVPTATPVPSPTPTEIPVAALVNGEPIYLSDFEQEVERARGAASREQILDAMIETELLNQAAARAGITISDEQLDEIIETDIETVGGREVFEQRLAENNISEDEYRGTVRSNLLAQQVQLAMSGEVPTTVEHVHARHILVATEDEAKAILAQIREGADFATLAQTYSIDVSTRDRGGDLGFFPRGLLLAPELEEVAFSLSPGQVSGVVSSELLGYHILQVLEREDRPLDEQNAELIQANQIRRWRQELWADASVERLVEP
jgi:parvulin-like peptidyl-prolyl isomerase